MAGRGNGGPLWTRSRKRWAIAAGAAGAWLLLLVFTGSVTGSLALFFLLVMLVLGLAMVLRSFGIGRDHPLARRLATRPWRDGREVLHLALRHLSEVFIVMPNGSLLAPSAVELHMNPADVESLADVIDLALVNANAAEAYEAEVAACSARIAHDIPVEVSVVADPEVPAGRYRLRQRKHSPGQGPVDRGPIPVHAGHVPVYGGQVPVHGGQIPVHAGRVRADETDDLFHDGFTRGDTATAQTMMTGEATVSEAAQIPLLRLVTGGTVAETRMPAARAGRGRAAELMLPPEPTISRVHARFAYIRGEWWITGVGSNGVVLNGTPLTGEHMVRDGDSIQWGRQASALVSRVEIR
jgi:hypothetical protein